MKSKLLILCMIAGLLTGCYDDKGGNDYDSVMPGVSISIPESAYSAALGSTITITPIIETSIPESDLQYVWEVNGDLYNEHGRSYFSPLVSEEEQGKVLNYTCKLSDDMKTLQQSYSCRLRVRQISTGRDFYSENPFTITIIGLTGLMVLHDDGSDSDVGILEADEFMPESSSLPESPRAVPNVYSLNNNGQKIAGKGINVIQSIFGYLDWASPEQKERCRIHIRTDKEAVWANKNDLAFHSSWNDLFYLQGDRQIHDNKPLGYLLDSGTGIAFDGDDIFLLDIQSYDYFMFSEYTPSTVCGDGNSFVFAPHFLRIAGGGGTQCVMYANSINGENKKGFVAFSQFMEGDKGEWTSLMDTSDDLVKFPLVDMKADLVVMRCDSREHVMAILKGEASHPQFPGKYFAVDLWPNADPAGNSGRANIPQHMYDISSFQNIDNALFFEFGDTKNMCYYATSSGVFRYGVDDSYVTSAEELSMSDGAALSFEGEITMMKFLNSPNIATHNTEPILLVATYNGTNSALYALHMDMMTGRVNRAVKYDASTVDGWNFGRISDVNIKGI